MMTTGIFLLKWNGVSHKIICKIVVFFCCIEISRIGVIPVSYTHLGNGRSTPRTMKGFIT